MIFVESDTPIQDAPFPIPPGSRHLPIPPGSRHRRQATLLTLSDAREQASLYQQTVADRSPGSSPPACLTLTGPKVTVTEDLANQQDSRTPYGSLGPPLHLSTSPTRQAAFPARTGDGCPSREPRWPYRQRPASELTRGCRLQRAICGPGTWAGGRLAGRQASPERPGNATRRLAFSARRAA